MPFEFLQNIFQTKLKKKFKKIYTTLFSLCRSLILPLMYLCNFRSSSSEIVTCNSPLCPLSNATSLIQIVFSKEELCQISHSDLIIDYLNRANLYGVPRVPVSIFGSETYKQETKIHPPSVPSSKISI